MARANSIFSLAPDAFTRQSKAEAVEKKLVVTVLGCTNLVPNPNTSTQSSYLSMRVVERYQWLEAANSRRASPVGTTNPSPKQRGGCGPPQKRLSSANDQEASTEEIIQNIGVQSNPGEAMSTMVLVLPDDPLGGGGASVNSQTEGGPPDGGSSTATASGPFTTSSHSSSGTPSRTSSFCHSENTSPKVRSGSQCEETQLDYLSDLMQSKTIENSLHPNFGETFDIRNLPIPLVRRSSICAVENSHISGKFDTSDSFGGYSEDVSQKATSKQQSRRWSTTGSGVQSDNSSGVHPVGSPFFKKRKMNQMFLLEIAVFDTSANPGAGIRSAEVEVNLGDLIEGKRVQVALPLTILNETSEEKGLRRKSYFAAPDSIFGATGNGGTEDEEESQRAGGEPTIELILEPTNMGVQPKKNLGGVSAELMDVLQDELGNTFSHKLLSELHRLLLNNGASGPPSRPGTGGTRSASGTMEDDFFLRGLSRAEMQDFLQELYYYTGTPVPDDDDVKNDVDFLFAVFDRDRNALMDISEICVMLKASAFAASVKPRWKKLGATVPGASKLGVPNVASSGSAGSVASASIAGALWTSQPPTPLEYPGFRQVNGHVVDRTRRPPESALSKPVFVPRDEEAESRARLLKAEALMAGGSSEGVTSEQGGTIPSQANQGGSQSSLPKSSGTQQIRKYSTGNPNEPRTRVSGERIDNQVVRDTELSSCTLTGCTLINCKLISGVVNSGYMESCIVTFGCDLQQVLQLRTCLVLNCRISNDTTITNCRISHSELVDLRSIMQSTLVDVKIMTPGGGQTSAGTRYTYTSMKECVFDGKIVDQGGNLLDGCKSSTEDSA